MARLKRGTRVWLGTVLSIVLSVALIGVLGGWQTSEARTLPLRQVGDTLEVPGWTIVVRDGASVVNYSEGSVYGTARSRVRLRLDLTSTGDETETFLPSGVLQVRLPDGTVVADGYAEPAEPWSGGWEPGVELASVMDFELTSLALDAAAPDQLEVLVHTREPARGFLTSDGEMRTGPARWRTPLELTDERVEVEE